MKHVNTSVKLSRAIIPLNGEWKVQPGTKDDHPTEWNHTLPVPALVDVSTPWFDWKQYEYYWYKTTFLVDEHYENVWLTIEQAMYGTKVWLNGTWIGRDIGCYTSQEYQCKNCIRLDSENELIIRVGAKTTLPPESAVGRDQERETFIPGIWGDVYLTLCGNPRIKLVQVIPNILTSQAEVKVWIENISSKGLEIEIHSKIVEVVTSIIVSPDMKQTLSVAPSSEEMIIYDIPINDVKLWNPENPFLYSLQTCLILVGTELDRKETRFGMREFKVVGSGFFLNGRKIYLRGGNIAFHRFLSDDDRGELPWNREWVKRLLIDIPKQHNFNFFRFHIGHAYNRWYDIADEYGMLIQEEWQFWTTTGTKEQITKEFTRWLQDNWNHPSIIIWDALNESTDKIVQEEIVPEMKKLDPTRPWESVDFVEQHPYIYSLGPVLIDEKFGFSESLHAIECSTKPSVVNEFLWWWINKDNMPTMLMKGIVERWLGADWTTDELTAHQLFLAQELVEVFRRMRVDAIQPFVYLSNNAGATANWFVGNISMLHPKPIMTALKNVFSPFGVSIELFDRHFVVTEIRTIHIYIFNDEPTPRKGTVRYGIMDEKCTWLNQETVSVVVNASDSHIISAAVEFPSYAGTFSVRAELYRENDTAIIAYSQKAAHVFNALKGYHDFQGLNVGVFDDRNEITEFLIHLGITPVIEIREEIDSIRAIIICEGCLRGAGYQSRIEEWTSYVKSGGTMIIIEPEFGVKEKEVVRIIGDIELTIERRVDSDHGGYDSYVFAESYTHSLWKDISKNHLKMFNGGFGGEIVSQHNVTPNKECTILARCGFALSTNAVFEIPYGAGKILVSRLQLRDRLVARKNSDELYARRADPVLQRYFKNLIAYSAGI